MMPNTFRIQITSLTERVPGECVDCGFDALRRVRGFHITMSGVNELFSFEYCGRCKAEELRERGE